MLSYPIFITTLSSLPLDDTVVTHVIGIGNWNLGDESVVTNDERVVNEQGFVVIFLTQKCRQNFCRQVTTNFSSVPLLSRQIFTTIIIDIRFS